MKSFLIASIISLVLFISLLFINEVGGEELLVSVGEVFAILVGIVAFGFTFFMNHRGRGFETIYDSLDFGGDMTFWVFLIVLITSLLFIGAYHVMWTLMICSFIYLICFFVVLLFGIVGFLINKIIKKVKNEL